MKTKIPDIVFIDRMMFLTPDNGWIAGTTGMNGKDLLVFRTVDGRRDWEVPNDSSAITAAGT